MMEEDDSIGFDLSAWEVPPPPDVADAVISRLAEPPKAAAIEPVARRPRWWIAASAIAAAAAVGAVVLATRGSPLQLAGGGAIATDRPTHVDFGDGTTAELDPATTLVWLRDGHRIVAMQGLGTATFKVAGEDTMVIDAGATTASVIASGASLRVEVEMNLSDAKTIGITAVAAAAVALVTVMVYEGHTSVSGGEHAVTVQPGTTVAVKSGDEPRLEAFERGLAAQKARIAELEAKLVKASAERDQAIKAAGTPRQPLAPPIDNKTVAICDYKLAVSQGDDASSRGAYAVALSQYQLALKCLPGDKQATRRAFVAACKSKNSTQAKALYAKLADRSLVQICLVEGIDLRTADDGLVGNPFLPVRNICSDAPAVADLEQKGDVLLTRGSYEAALARYEEILKCKPGLLSKMYLAACRGKNVAKAKAYFRQFSAQRQDSMAQICMKEGFDPRRD